MKRFIILGLIALTIISCEKESITNDKIQNDSDTLIISDNVAVYDSLNFYKGYTLVAPLGSNNTYLINMEGFVVHYWESNYRPGNSVYLLEDSRLLRTQARQNKDFNAGGSGGGIEIQSFDGNKEWEYSYSTTEHCQHHDATMLPNGNILFIAWEAKTKAEAIAAGRDSANVTNEGLWSEMLIEVKPVGTNDGEIVWEWHAWDHLIQDFDATKNNYGVIADHPELIDINYSSVSPDIFHCNGLAYVDEFDQIILSSKSYSEVWIIDHLTSTSEAQQHVGGNRNKGGDLIYRWGNPAVYQCGNQSDQILFGQHNPSWIDGLPNNGGNFLIFNNGDMKTRSYSTVDEVKLPCDAWGNYNLISNQINGPESVEWSYTNDDLFSNSISGAQRLENGNTLICEGVDGIFYEVTNDQNIVWQYSVPLSRASTFRAYRYAYNDPMFDGKDLEILDVEIL